MKPGDWCGLELRKRRGILPAEHSNECQKQITVVQQDDQDLFQQS